MSQRRRELFLHQYDITAQSAFSDPFGPWAHRAPAAEKLVEIARAAFGYPRKTPPSIIYRALHGAWRRMQGRKDPHRLFWRAA